MSLWIYLVSIFIFFIEEITIMSTENINLPHGFHVFFLFLCYYIDFYSIDNTDLCELEPYPPNMQFNILKLFILKFGTHMKNWFSLEILILQIIICTFIFILIVWFRFPKNFYYFSFINSQNFNYVVASNYLY